MAIKIVKEPDLELTQSDYVRLMYEYQNFTMGYCGRPPDFESWVRGKLEAKMNSTETI